jgi:hypothetical protein
MTTTNSTKSESGQILTAAGIPHKLTKYAGRCDCGCPREAGKAWLVTIGQNKIVCCKRVSCVRALLSEGAISVGEAGGNPIDNA